MTAPSAADAPITLSYRLGNPFSFTVPAPGGPRSTVTASLCDRPSYGARPLSPHLRASLTSDRAGMVKVEMRADAVTRALRAMPARIAYLVLEVVGDGGRLTYRIEVTG